MDVPVPRKVKVRGPSPGSSITRLFHWPARGGTRGRTPAGQSRRSVVPMPSVFLHRRVRFVQVDLLVPAGRGEVEDEDQEAHGQRERDNGGVEERGLRPIES